MFDITPILEAVIIIIGIVAMYVVIPYIKSKTTAQQQADIKWWITTAVSAAEQIYLGAGRGPEKKQYVLEWLKSNNIKIDENKIDALIEATVLEINKNFSV